LCCMRETAMVFVFTILDGDAMIKLPVAGRAFGSLL
jgi:hypothetical protein